MKKVKEWAIVQRLPDGINYFAGIATQVLPSGTVIKGNVWATDINQALPNEFGDGGGIFLNKHAAIYFLDTYLKESNPDAKVVRLKQPKFFTNVKPELFITKQKKQ